MKKVILRIPTTIKPVELRIRAEDRWKTFHPDIYDCDEKYSLLYENGTEVEKKHAWYCWWRMYTGEVPQGKDYKQITFYLWKNNNLTVKRKLESFQEDEYFDETETKRIHLDVEESEASKIDTFDGMLATVDPDSQFVTEQPNDWQFSKED